ncbi:hypothetical protein Pst134EA_026836 [Puccinia striiformis f. sp. tritici]|nr:hypothetical protein Pst134EA_026836 [Puccinia striiformis f. sp. tritici]KAH9443047.1 hypothetical protein Pst134EB_027401 [Puccinia striiformis f. sp. tritici]KAH9450126.1 hypothetical protein Pst134EA_026836 [Puccinia striiformis f. sp. tritici]KAI9626528.1 hypothetical protein KEM48_010356 [Puccinia striiformis f. sp. tritici PST-130]KNF06083.1 hypothetical protein PSTG_00595 [Puccinia striiformis f. sp. tritici PST-78]
MKAFKKHSIPNKPRDCSPSFSSTSSSSSSSAQQYLQKLHDYRLTGNHTKVNPSPEAHISKPEIVIRALKSYSAQTPSELSFKAGDFLQVIGEAYWSPQGSGWFEATEPLTRTRGFVPIDMFQIFSSGGYQPSPPSNAVKPLNVKASNTGASVTKSSAPRAQKSGNGTHQSHPALASQPARDSSSNKPPAPRQPLYGVVRYDFHPERNDELLAKKGEAIVLIAHSHHDWFVAKPIGRLGGPGLIPVSYVEVKDLATGKGLKADAVQKLIQNDILPGVDEWIRATTAYKGNSIPLGRFENPSATSTLSQNITPTLRREMTKSHQQLRSKHGEVDEQIPRPPRTSLSKAANQGTSFHGSQLVDIPVPSSHSVEDKTTCSEPLRSPKPAPVLARVASYDPSIIHDMKAEASQCGQTSTASGEDGYATVEDLRERYGLFTHATVESFHSEHGEYWFHLRSHFNCPSTTNSSGEETTTLVLYRLYDDFFDFHAELLDLFPEEAGRENYDRPSIFPRLPEPKETVDDLLCSERVNSLSIYLQELSKLPSYIRDSEIFYEFLGPREGDVELLEEMASSLGSEDRNLSEEIEQLKSSNPTSTGSPYGESEADIPSHHPISFISAAPKRSSRQQLRLSSSPMKNYGGTPEPNPTFLPLTPSSHTPKPHGKTHKSNFSVSSTGSFMDNMTTPLATSHFPRVNEQSSPQPFYRLKVYQENSSDVIAIKASHDMTRAQLLDKVFERVQAAASEPLSDQRIGKLHVKDETKASTGWKELETDEQLSQWLVDFQSRLALLYTPAD